jgi:hypothetical protein
MNLTPEQKARVDIDAALVAAGWILQNRDAINLAAGTGVAVREAKMASGHGFAVAEVADDDRHLMQLGRLGSPPASLTADDLIDARRAGLGPRQDGLEDAVFADGGGQFLEARLVHPATRLEGPGLQRLDRQGPQRGLFGGGGGPIRDQGGEAATEAGGRGLAGGAHRRAVLAAIIGGWAS